VRWSNRRAQAEVTTRLINPPHAAPASAKPAAPQENAAAPDHLHAERQNAPSTV
jgi:hypothetical protein